MIWRKKILVRVSFSFFHSVLPLWKLRNFTSTVFSLKFCHINVLQKLYYKLVWRKKNWLGSEFRFTTLHSVEITEIISHFFGRNFVKAPFSLKKLLKSWFHEIFFRRERISHFYTLCYVHCEAEIEKYFVWMIYIIHQRLHSLNSGHMDITKVLYCSETIPEINQKFRQINSTRTLF